MTIDGSFLIGGREVRGADTFEAWNPATGETLDPPFTVSSPLLPVVNWSTCSVNV